MKLFVAVHKDSVSYLIGDVYNASTWHNVFHQSYELKPLQEFIQGMKFLTILQVVERNGSPEYEPLEENK